MKTGALSAGIVAWIGAALSSLCCLLPLAVIALGLGSGAFMAVTMQYRWLLIPAGVVGVTTGLVLYVRERRRCTAAACRMAGSRVTLALLILAMLVVTTRPPPRADVRPSREPDQSRRLPWRPRYARHAMNRTIRVTLMLLLALALTTNAAFAATATVVLTVDGMT